MLPGSVEDFNILELHTNAFPQVHHFSGIVFIPPLNGAIGVRSDLQRGHRSFNLSARAIESRLNRFGQTQTRLIHLSLQ